MQIIAHILWFSILAAAVIGVFGWFSLVYVLAIAGAVFCGIYKDDNKKLAATLVVTAIAIFSWLLICIKYDI